jgi:hypothetical protein
MIKKLFTWQVFSKTFQSSPSPALGHPARYSIPIQSMRSKHEGTGAHVIQSVVDRVHGRFHGQSARSWFGGLDDNEVRGGAALERLLAGDQLIHEDAEGVDVRLWGVAAVGGEKLWSGVCQRANVPLRCLQGSQNEHQEGHCIDPTHLKR